MNLPKTYTIKMEDKAAFINKAEKMGYEIDTFDIKDNKITNTFTITVSTPQDVEVVKAVLKSSPDINDIKEVIKRTIQEEIQKHLEN
jgi:cell division protein FtsX